MIPGKKQWTGVFLLCLLALGMAIYCGLHASFLTLHLRFAETEDLKLFPEIGRELDICLWGMMGAVVALAWLVGFLLGKTGSEGQP